MHECPTNNKDQDFKGKKVSQATMDSKDEGSEDSFGEFYLMTIKEESEEDFERAFEDIYVESKCMAKKNKELIEQLETINRDKEALEEKLKCTELEPTHAKARE